MTQVTGEARPVDRVTFVPFNTAKVLNCSRDLAFPPDVTYLCTAECSAQLTTLLVRCSAFYERLKEVRDYHRRYPYLEVTEVCLPVFNSRSGQHL